MNLLSWILVGAVAVWFVAAIVRMIRSKGGCSCGCGGTTKKTKTGGCSCGCDGCTKCGQ